MSLGSKVYRSLRLSVELKGEVSVGTVSHEAWVLLDGPRCCSVIPAKSLLLLLQLLELP